MGQYAITRRRALSTLTFGTALLALPKALRAQDFPRHPLTIILPYPVGGTTDVIARAMQPAMLNDLGQPVIIDARPGASGMIATRFVSRAPADGYTVLMQTNSLVMTPHISKSAGVEPLRDFEPVTLVARQPMVLVCHPSLPVHSVKELIAFAKANPEKIEFGSSGIASNGHLATELFMRQAGIAMTHIPYKGMSQITLAVLAGEVKLMLTSITPQIREYVKEGKLRYLGVASLAASPLLPDVEPIAETLPGFQAEVWYGLLLPRGTPPEIVARIQGAAVKAVSVPAVRTTIEAAGAEAIGSSSQAFKAQMEREYQDWGEIIAKVGITGN